MRKAINGLMVLVSDVLEADTLLESSVCFLQSSERQDRNLSIGTTMASAFSTGALRSSDSGGPQTANKLRFVASRELSWLLEGLDVTQVKAHKMAKFALFLRPGGFNDQVQKVQHDAA